MSKPRPTDEELDNLKKKRLDEIEAARAEYKANKAERLLIIKGFLGIESLDVARFYAIGNMSAVVVRDNVNNTTTCALSFYNPNDGLEFQDTSDLNMLIPIGYVNMYYKCMHAAMNYKENKYKYQLPYIELSELAVYKTWMMLKKEGKLPYKYMKKSLSNCIHFSGSFIPKVI